LPSKKIVNPLFSFLLDGNSLRKWRAVTAMGAVVSQLANSNMEAARVVIRRLMWNLNDESGGIGWGSPEAMGEILARHDDLADEYHKILVSYIDPNGNYLEHELLHKGVLWAIGRFAHARPRLGNIAKPLITPFMDSADKYTQGLAAWICGLYLHPEDSPSLKRLLNDDTKILFYTNNYKLEEVTIRCLAKTKPVKERLWQLNH